MACEKLNCNSYGKEYRLYYFRNAISFPSGTPINLGVERTDKIGESDVHPG